MNDTFSSPLAERVATREIRPVESPEEVFDVAALLDCLG